MSGRRFLRIFLPVVFFTTLAAVLYLWMQPRGGEDGDRASINRAIDQQRESALVQAVQRVGPSVVSIGALEESRQFTSYQPMEDMFLQRFWEELSPFGNEGKVPRLGSGIVIDSRGFFLTNDHLVGRAQEIWVTLSDGRQFEAEMVGTDPNYDLAVIKVKLQGQMVFETSPIGDSDDLMVGEWALAVGNPYGYLFAQPKPSVTAGVISALHRDVRDSQGGPIYKDMIQTDASINPGNSGGPLINANGEVIGINTFIFTQGGVSLGLGFAIPINTALEVAEELILYGHVRGVWTGIAVLGLDEISDKALAVLGAQDRRGVVVWTLEQGSPAQQAGIRLGDIIRAVDDERVTGSEEARRAIYGARVGDTIEFTVQRGGDLVGVPVTLQPLPDEHLRRGVP